MSLYSFIVQLSDTLQSIAKIIFRSHLLSPGFSYKANSTDELVVLGNGPSLRQSLDRLSTFLVNRKCMAVNGFSISDDYELVKPGWYVLVDPGFWNLNPGERISHFREMVYQNLIAKTTWPLVVQLPNQAKKSFVPDLLSQNKLIRIEYFNKTTVTGFVGFRNLCYRRQLGMPRPQNVLIPSLINGINMNFKRIFVLGADHSWHETIRVDDSNMVSLVDSHFYDKNGGNIVENRTDQNSLIPIHKQFQSLAIAFECYFLIASYAQSRGCSILNASEKSYIDAFQKVKL